MQDRPRDRARGARRRRRGRARTSAVCPVAGSRASWGANVTCLARDRQALPAWSERQYHRVVRAALVILALTSAACPYHGSNAGDDDVPPADARDPDALPAMCGEPGETACDGRTLQVCGA